MDLAWDKDYSRVVCESGSFEAIRLIAFGSVDSMFHFFQATVLGIKDALRRDWVVSFRHVLREANADFLAKLGASNNIELSMSENLPSALFGLLQDDYTGSVSVFKACAFRDSYEKFKKAGAEVVGISVNDPSSHKAFAKKYRLPFTLLSDEGNKVSKEWGVPDDFFGALPGRQTYVLDKNGVVQLIYNNQFKPESILMRL